MRWTRPLSRTLGEQVTEMILQRIAAGDLPPGATLPPQRELAREFGVALSVVNLKSQAQSKYGDRSNYYYKSKSYYTS